MFTAIAASNSDINMSAGEIRTVAWAWGDPSVRLFFFFLFKLRKFKTNSGTHGDLQTDSW